MALASCPSCGHTDEDTRKFCAECGMGFAVATAERNVAPSYDRRDVASRMTCPGCGSEQFKKLSLIRDAGVSHVSTKSGGLGVGLGGSIGIGAAKTTGQHVTELARKAAPPEPKSVAMYLFVGLIAGAVLGGMISSAWTNAPGAFALIGAGVAFYKVSAYNQGEYQNLMRAWSQKFMCERCGEVFAREP